MGKLKVTKRKPTPEAKASAFSFLFFAWLTPMFNLAIERSKTRESLELSDLWEPLDVDSSKTVADIFMLKYEAVKKQKESKINSSSGKLSAADLYDIVVEALFAVGWNRFVQAGVLKIFNTMLQFMYPVCVNGILTYIELVGTEKQPPVHVGYIWALALGCAMLIKALTENHYFHLQQRVAWQTRTALQAAIYRKSLRLSVTSRQQKSVGQIVNLMQIDAMKIEFFASQIHMLWDGAFQIIGYTSIIVYYMGPAALVGLLVMCIAVPFQRKIMKHLFLLARSMVKFTDLRVKTVNEALQGVRCVKYYSWEKPLKDRIEEFRKKEITKLKNAAYVRAFSRAYMSAVPSISASAAFIAYWMLGGAVKASILFTVLQGFSQLRFPLMFYPMAVAAYANAKVGLVRIADFLGMADSEDYVVHKNMADCKTNIALKVEKGEFWWEDPQSITKKEEDVKDEGKMKMKGQAEGELKKKVLPRNPILQDVSFSVKTGHITCVVGTVGSGKSSLVKALLSEMVKTKGTVEITGNIAYCGQTAWILNSTIKDNIVFNEEYDEEKYYRILKACQLENDLISLEAGDATEIGERGINLSGGQKQRISLARAAYSSKDIYLLDDPLSALDPSVANKVFDECIKNLLRGKTVFMVTNQLQFLCRCDQILVLRADDNGEGIADSNRTGRIVEMGTYDSLMADGKAFCELMKKSGNDNKSKDLHESDDFSTEDIVEPNGVVLNLKNQKDKMQHSTHPGSSASYDTLKRMMEERAVGAKKLIEAEEKRSGAVKLSVYISFMKAAGGIIPFLVVVLWYILVVGSNFTNTIWVSWWTADAPEYRANTVEFYVIGYAVVAIAVAILTFCRTVLITNFGLLASKTMHKNLLDSILAAPMSFFDTTPIGRIISRFSGDIHSMDTELIQFMDFVFWCGLYIIATFSVITYVTPWFAVVIPFLLGIYYYILYYFRSVYLGSKRLDSISKSPVFAHFSETLGGLSTIRAYGKNQEFVRVNENNININIGAYYLMKSCDRWLSLRLEALGGVIATVSGLLAVIATSGPTPLPSSIAGLSIYYASTSTGIFSWFVRQFAAMENAMNSVERVQHYSINVPREEPIEMANSNDPKRDINGKSWPTDGAITIRKLNMRYRKDLPLVLKDLDLTIPGGAHVGIVGRTGCGKSSLMLCLLRLVEPELNSDNGRGPILLDDADICALPLKRLRSAIGIIPQNPTLFSGTIRSNLDPFGSFSDAKIWDVLEKCGLKDHVQTMDEGIDSKVVEYGENLSQGQRQLLCLGRVLLKDCKILLLDEATSSVDYETDQMIQETLRKNFKNTTVLTIAHRINTIMDSDKIIVLDEGRVAEVGSPAELLEDSSGNGGGHFKMLVEASNQ